MKRTLSDKAALNFIQQVLSGNEWNADALEEVAEAVRATGREIDDLDDDELSDDDDVDYLDFSLDDEGPDDLLGGTPELDPPNPLGLSGRASWFGDYELR